MFPILSRLCHARLILCLIALAGLAACSGGAPDSKRDTARYLSHARGNYQPPGPPEDPWGPYIKEASTRLASLLTNEVHVTDLPEDLKRRPQELQKALQDYRVGFAAVQERLAKGEGSIGKLLTDESLYRETVGTMKSLNKTATDVQSLMTEAKGSLGDVKLALGDARKTLNTATETMTTAKQTLTDVRADLQAGKGSLGKLLKDEGLYNESALAMRNLREIMEKINKGQGSVGKFVNDDSLFKNAKMTLQKLDKATEGLEDQGPLSVLGIAVNSLF